MAEENLKVCPFCGREPEIMPWHGGGPDKHMITCPAEYVDECGATPAVTGETKAEAIARWNTRAEANAGNWTGAPPMVNVREELDHLRGRIAMFETWISRATSFSIDEGVEIRRRGQIDGADLWAVVRYGDCLTTGGDWEYEPLPSSRSDAFIRRTRFASIEEALAAFNEWKEKASGKN